MDKVDYADFLHWTNHPIHKLFVAHLKEYRGRVEGALLNYHSENLGEISKYIAKLNTIDDVLGISYEDLVGDDIPSND